MAVHEQSGGVREQAVEAAMMLLAEASVDDLLKFYTSASVTAKLMNVDESSVRSALDSTPGGKRLDRAFLAELLLDRMMAELKIATKANADGYLQAAEAVTHGGGRESVLAAVLGDMRDFTVDGADADIRARERMYYLSLTLADGDDAIRESLADGYEAFREIYGSAYKAFLEATNRRIASDTSEDALRHALSALLEGFTSHRRFGKGGTEEEAVDAVMRVFAAYTVPKTEARRPLDEELFRRPLPIDGDRGPVDGVVHHTGESLYDAAIAAIDAVVESDATLSICSLHGHRGQRHGSRSRLARGLKDAADEHIAGGGRLRRIATYLDLERFENDLDEMEELCTRVPDARVEARALIVDAPPVLGPLIVGGSVGFIARDDHHYQGADGGIELRGAHGLQMCERAFADLWDDRRAEWIWTEAGPFDAGIARTRERLVTRGSSGSGAAT